MIAALSSVWSSIEDLLGQLDEGEWAGPTPDWDVRDVVFHMIETESDLLRAPVPAASTPRVMRGDRADATTRRLEMLWSMSDHDWEKATFAPVRQFTYKFTTTRMSRTHPAALERLLVAAGGSRDR